jgi:HAD superfamily hydrolase (TIGR01509 family)
MIKSVISDLGKVIIFFDNHIFFKKIARYSLLSEDEIVAKVYENLELLKLFDTGKVSPDEFYGRAKALLQTEIDQEAFYSLYNDVFSLNLPVLETLKSLRPDLRLVLCSNTDVERFGFIRKFFPEILFFDDYVLSYEVGVMKPHPRIYEVAIEKAAAKAEECVFIDDREENIAAARELRLETILLAPDTELERELRLKGIQV